MRRLTQISKEDAFYCFKMQIFGIYYRPVRDSLIKQLMSVNLSHNNHWVTLKSQYAKKVGAESICTYLLVVYLCVWI